MVARRILTLSPRRSENSRKRPIISLMLLAKASAGV
jgi:hypothetical protein